MINAFVHAIGTSHSVTYLCIILLAVLIPLQYKGGKSTLVNYARTTMYTVLAVCSFCQLHYHDLWFTHDTGIITKYFYIVLFLIYVRVFFVASIKIMEQWQNELQSDCLSTVVCFIFAGMMIAIVFAVVLSLFWTSHESWAKYVAYAVLIIALGSYIFEVALQHYNHLYIILCFWCVPLCAMRFIGDVFYLCFDMEYMFYLIFAFPIAFFSRDVWRYHREMEAWRSLQRSGRRPLADDAPAQPGTKCCRDTCLYWQQGMNDADAHCTYGASNVQVYYERRCIYGFSEDDF